MNFKILKWDNFQVEIKITQVKHITSTRVHIRKQQRTIN